MAVETKGLVRGAGRASYPWLRWLGVGILLLIALAAPFYLYPVLLMTALCFALFACAFNLLVGFVGLLSFGHAAFFGGAAYVTAHAAKVWGLTPELAILPLDAPLVMYYFVLAVFLLGFLVIYRTIHSPFGQVLKAIRENEARAVSLGYKVERFKLAAFVMSATLAGLAGGTKAIAVQLASLTDVQWQMSGGPIVGAVLVIVLQNFLAGSQWPVTVVLGAIFVVCVLLFRRGIVGELARIFRLKGV